MSRRRALQLTSAVLATPTFVGCQITGAPEPIVWPTTTEPKLEPKPEAVVAPTTAAEAKAMVGQLLVLGLPAKSATDESAQLLAAQIAKGQVGGTVLLRHNIKDRESLLGLASLFVRANPRVLNAIDQEGGLVQRLSTEVGFKKIPRAYWVANNLGDVEARELYFAAGKQLRGAGFNLNLAPSVDWHDPNNPVIGKHGRSFGSQASNVASYAGSFIDGMKQAGVATTLKHFPGHGTSRGDSHNGFVDITSTWSSEELKPFQLLAEKAQVIMGGHLFHPSFSNGELPVTFSERALRQVLRDKLRFGGVVITDDLDMGAIRNNFSLQEAVIYSLRAGNDMLLMSNSLQYDSQLPVRVADWVLAALEKGTLQASALAEAYSRVMKLKQITTFSSIAASASHSEWR